MLKLSFNLAFVFIFGCVSLLQADLPYTPVTFKLQTSKSVYQVGERIDFRLKVYNNDKNRSYPIVLPGSQNKGQKLIQLRFYSVNEKTNFYTCVAKENPEFKMSCEKPGNVTVRQLAPGDSLEIVFFLNDRKNFLSQTASHHELDQPLLPGSYQVHVFYNPSVTELRDLYHYIWSTNDSTSSEKINFWSGGNVCQYIPITISKSATAQKSFASNPSCTRNCAFCKAIDDGNWSALKKTLEKNIQKSADFDIALAQTHWMKAHRNVVWVSAPPQSVLSSLPTFFSYDFIFVSREELYYYSAVYQWGIVYQSRSRLNQMFRSSRPNPLLPGEDLSYIGLISFGEIHCGTALK
jgi:hypothetical protein